MEVTYMSIIQVQNLTKTYKSGKGIFDISFTVDKGEVFGYLGPNGAGKTTTVEILECLRTPSSGKATVLGCDITNDAGKIKGKIGIMPQEFNTFDRLTARENIKLMADLYRNKSFEETIDLVGVNEFENKKFSTLSGGMKTKVGMAMALVSRGDLLFLDEPTTGLDPQSRRETWKLIRELNQEGKTIFLTTHYMEEVEELSDRAAVIIEGELKAINSITNLIEKYGGGVKLIVGKEEAKKLINDNTDRVFETREGELTGIFDSKKKAKKIVGKLFEMDCEFEIKEAGMEEVFLSLVGGRINEGGKLL